MNSEWLTYTLDQVCEKITDGAHNSPKTVLKGKPMASVKDLTRFGVDLSSARLIPIEDFNKLVRQGCQPEIGDVLIAKDGNSALDTVCTVDTPLDAILLSSVAILRPNKEKLDSDFLKYYFCSPQIIEYLKSNFISGAAIPRVVLKDFKKAQIRLPEINIQKKMSSILRLFDDKIHLNTKTNLTLEQIAQAIFKSWFVDFDPVKAKMAVLESGGTKKEAEREAMCVISGKDEAALEAFRNEKPELFAELEETATLFPAAMQDSELGEIPEGWSTIPLYETAEYINGSAFKANDFTEPGKGLPIIKIAELKQGVYEGTKFTAKQCPEKYLIDDGEVLYSWSGSPETSLEIFKWFGGKGLLNQHIFRLVFQSNEQKHFTYYLLRQIKPLLIATAKQKQTTGLGHITVADMKRIKLPFPTGEIFSCFSSKVKDIYNKCSSLEKENISLREIRDALLPELLNGNIYVEAEVS